MGEAPLSTTCILLLASVAICSGDVHTVPPPNSLPVKSPTNDSLPSKICTDKRAPLLSTTSNLSLESTVISVTPRKVEPPKSSPSKLLV